MKKLLSLLLLLSSAFAHALELSGDLIQGGMVIGRTEPGSLVWLDKRALKVSEQGVFVIGFGRDAKASALLRMEHNGKQHSQTLRIKKRDYVTQRINGISRSITNPSAESLARIRRDSAEVREARKQLLDRMDFAGSFQWPLIGPITGVYGSQRIYNGVPKRPHFGVDIAAPNGTPVTTPAPGVVTLAHPDMFYSGGTLIIDHGFGVSSTLIHLSKLLVEVGQEVKPGDIVAEVGAGGRATGPHLDWRMNWLDQRIDPQLLVSAMPNTDAKQVEQ